MNHPLPALPRRPAARSTRHPARRSPWLTSAACALGLLAALQASAANVWDGGGADGNWSSAANWDDDLVPAFPIGLTFGGANQLAATNDLADLVVNGLFFANGAGAFTVGGNAISLGGNIENTSASLQTLSLPLALTAGRSVNAAFGDVALSGSVTGAFDFIKIGSHTLTLSGVHSYTGRTGVGNFPNGVGVTPSTHQGGGTLVLDFSAPASPVSNLIYNGITPVAAQELRLSAGTVVLKGKDATENAQTVGQLGVATGFNTVSLQPGAGGKVVLNLGAIALAAGAGADNNKSALVNFVLPPGAQDATNGVTTSSVNHSSGILTPISGNIANLVVNGSSWAANATNAAGGNIVALPDASYTPSTETTTGSATQNVDMVTDTSVANPSPWTLRFNNTGATGPRILTNTNAGAAMTIAGGGILVTPGMGANDVTITGGLLRGSSNRGLFLSNYNTGGGQLIINSNLTNNGNSNALTVGGGGVVRLGGVNTYTNGTYVLDDTTLVVSSDNNLGFGSGAVTVVSASTASPTVTLAAAGPGNGSWVVGASFLGSTITAITGGTTITLAGNANADIASDTAVSYASSPALSLDGGTLRADGSFEMRRTKAVDASGVGGDAVADRRIGLSALGGTIEVTAENTLVVHGIVSSQGTSGFGALTKTGPGTLQLNGANTYAGGTTIQAGTLRAGSNAALGSSGATLTFAPAAGAIFQLNGKLVTVGGLSADASAVIENSGATHGTLIVNSARAVAFPGTLRNGSSNLLQLTKQGSGTLTLSSANTHGGDTLLSSGSIILAHSLALQSSSLNQQVGTGSGLVFDASVTSRAFTLGGLKNNGAPTIALENNAVAPEPVALSIGGNNFNSTYGGVFTGAGSLTKIGTGRITLTGLNAHTGATSIAAGTLALSGAGLLGAGPVTVASTGTLDLSGLDAASHAFSAGLSGGGVIEATGKTVQIDGALTPVGRLRVTGDVTLGAAADGTFGVSAVATNDSVAVTGHLALDGELAVVTIGEFAFAGGQSFDLYDSATAALGLDAVTVNGLALVNASGTWTASASGLSYAFAESTGVLEITGGSTGTALETWRSDHFGSAANSGDGADLADPDGDGVANLLEYATGTNPNLAAASAVALGQAGGFLTLSYTRIADPALTYTVEASTDLVGGAWAPVAVAGNPSTGSANVAGVVTITDTVATTAQPRRFLRLKVSY